MFMCDVTFLDNQTQDNSMWWPGYKQENQGIVVQFSRRQQVSLLQSIQFGSASNLSSYPVQTKGSFSGG
jgi:hypothetical protein